MVREGMFYYKKSPSHRDVNINFFCAKFHVVHSPYLFVEVSTHQTTRRGGVKERHMTLFAVNHITEVSRYQPKEHSFFFLSLRLNLF